ncbi:MAG: proline--tRNA ligase [Oscillospiraceae bacterium]|jgi:prolyl-tRNA synthetase|nr:proline--tRNA ligase [Oscillospiraceae bacterium]
MANQKKLVTAITSRDTDFAQWYTDIVTKAELVSYTGVKGCLAIRPYGWAIWENIQRILNDMFKATGHENVSMPMFIPEGLLQKEKDHVEGFAPEVAWVTLGGAEELTERLCVRPTSETLFCEHYAQIIKSHRDLPKLYNQWCSVVRWEKTTRPFLRSREFHWQEGHTAHATADDAIAETERMLDIYAEFAEKYLNMPVIKGRKTESDKFAGAVATYAIEALMHDGKSLQAGTSHYFGDGFARAFEIQYADKNNTLQYVHQTSWGVSTRLIGGLIMTHGDDDGLVLPPAIAPIQVAIIPVQAQKEGVLDKAREIADTLTKAGVRVKLDDSDNSPGWKFAEYEMKGVPLRIEIGPRDIAEGKCMSARRDTREKQPLSLDGLTAEIPQILEKIGHNIYNKALENRSARYYTVETESDITKAFADKGDGYAEGDWCGSEECEKAVKEATGAGSRSIIGDGHNGTGKCIHCGKTAKHTVIWAKAY